MQKIKQEKGITIVSLVITMIVLSILTFTIILNTKESSEVQNLMNLRTDISNLKEKISNFYNEYGELPADIEYTNIENIKGILNNVELSEDSKFYVIDLQAMKGISLYYGSDYEEVKNTNTSKANLYTDLYIVNDATHNIFYVQGVSGEGKDAKMHYTNYDVSSDVPTI